MGRLPDCLAPPAEGPVGIQEQQAGRSRNMSTSHACVTCAAVSAGPALSQDKRVTEDHGRLGHQDYSWNNLSHHGGWGDPFPPYASVSSLVL